MSYGDSIVQLSRQLSAGLLADEVLLILYKHRKGIDLGDPEVNFIKRVVAGLKALAQFADTSAFELALSNPIKTAAADADFAINLMPEFDPDAFRQSKIVSDILEGLYKKEAVQATEPAFEYFDKISRRTVAASEKYVRA